MHFYVFALKHSSTQYVSHQVLNFLLFLTPNIYLYGKYNIGLSAKQFDLLVFIAK